jgi:hypothetical protein
MRSYYRPIGFTLIVCLVISGCATTPLDKARHQFEQGKPKAAIATLESEGTHSKRSALLFLMNKGLIFHSLGDYKSSAQELRQAAKLMDSQDYISLSQQTTTLLINDWAANYKGEYSERLWVHTYQMMNYLLLGQYDSAAVEARQSINVIKKHPQPLKDDWFTQTLMGLSFESTEKINDAYIIYKKLAENMPNPAAIARPLSSIAQQLGFSKDERKYTALTPSKLKGLEPTKQGELILFFANGFIPQKTSGEIYAPPDIRISFPRYEDSYTSSPSFQVHVDSEEAPFTVVASNLATIAKASLDARGKAIFAKHAARVGIKQSLVHNLKKDNEAAAELLNLLFFLLENADTRGWDTLPENLAMLRIPLTPGTHDIVIRTRNTSHFSNEIHISNLAIKARQRIYRKIRH